MMAHEPGELFSSVMLPGNALRRSWRAVSTSLPLLGLHILIHTAGVGESENAGLAP